MYAFIVAKPEIDGTQMARYENWQRAIVLVKTCVQFGSNEKCYYPAMIPHSNVNHETVVSDPKEKYTRILSRAPNRYD